MDTVQSIFRNRVYTALSFKEPDICPYYIWIDPEMLESLINHYNNPELKKNYIYDHTVMIEITAEQCVQSDGTSRDEFGTIWQKGNILHVVKPALTEPSLTGYKFPDLSTFSHYAHIENWLKEYHDRFKIVQLGLLFFERTWAMRGFQEIMTDFCEHSRFVEELLDSLAELSVRIIDKLIELYGNSIDAIGFSDDYGGEHTMLLSPAMWRKFIKPRIQKMYSRIKKAGKKVYLHSCGHISPIIPDLIEVGVDILQPIQPETMDIFALKRDFGRDLCFAGGISTQKTLPFGTPEQVRDEVNRCLEIMGKDGGYIIAPAKPILPGVPVPNAVSLIESIVNQKPKISQG
ncbi:MAG TPA: uroporphyrinogen decarboxylase family protein [bacterium]|nr:uroporphyrinogen decarboxylase family protein [bacterium]HOL35013.1 uroporphyrinogen decarboxylase family protein [bacterium]HPP07976.1 uroporphyrinogen decarboxylase family protein [bacterium]